jgi:hypothetical protein
MTLLVRIITISWIGLSMTLNNPLMIGILG